MNERGDMEHSILMDHPLLCSYWEAWLGRKKEAGVSQEAALFLMACLQDNPINDGLNSSTHDSHGTSENLTLII